MSSNEKPFRSPDKTVVANDSALKATVKATIDATPFEEASARELPRSPIDERYERISLLGRGGMGEVHLCADKVVGREIAMKMILPQARSAGLERFIREAKVQARLEHPSIVPVYDIGTREDGTVWFTMKRVKGRSLEEVLEQLANKDAVTLAEFSRRKLLTAFVAVCYAVAFAHEHGVVHRDLKPGNIMLGSFGEVSVLDWGIAKLSDVADDQAVAAPLADLASGARATEQGVVVGTPGFMAPEQARGESDKVTPAADVYALGAILFELLALQPLHLGTSAIRVIASTLKEVDARPSTRGADVPPELDTICVGATRLDVRERTQNARDLAKAIERYLDGDRDLERRRELAAEHTANANAALAGDIEHPSAAARPTALLELGRALALDPSNGVARDLMARLMMTVPDEVPPEARAELDAERSRARRAAARGGAGRYLIWCGFAPFVFWMGVRNWPLAIVVFSFMGVSSAIAYWMTRRKSSGTRSMMTLLVTSFITLALVSELFGPFTVVPSLAATNAMYFAMSMEARHRPWTILAGVAAIAVPFALQLAHVIAPSYDIGVSVESFRVIAKAAYFPAVPTAVMLILTSVGTAIVPVTMVGRMRDALTKAEQRLFLQAWQLRATLPTEAQAPLVGNA